jgi:hypothetical protein
MVVLGIMHVLGAPAFKEQQVPACSSNLLEDGAVMPMKKTKGWSENVQQAGLRYSVQCTAC